MEWKSRCKWVDLDGSHDIGQAALLAEFDRLRQEYNFETVDASGDAESVCARLKASTLGILDQDLPQAVVSNPTADLIEALAQGVAGNLIPKRHGGGDHPGGDVEIVGHQFLPSISRNNGRVAL